MCVCVCVREREREREREGEGEGEGGGEMLWQRDGWYQVIAEPADILKTYDPL